MKYLILFTLLFSFKISNASNWISQLGNGFKEVHSDEKIKLLENPETDEKIVISRSELILNFNEMQKFLDQRTYRSDIENAFGLYTNYKEIEKINTSRKLTRTYQVYTLHKPISAVSLIYQKIIVNKNELVSISYSPGLKNNRYQNVLKNIPENPWFRQNSKFDLFISPAVAAEKLNCGIRADIRNKLAEITNSLETSCESNVNTSDVAGSVKKVAQVVGSCFKSLALGFTEFVQFVYAIFDTLAESYFNSTYRQELKISFPNVSLFSMLNQENFFTNIYETATNGFLNSFSKLKNCSAEYQAAKICEIIGFFAAPFATAKAAKGIQKIVGASKGNTTRDLLEKRSAHSASIGTSSAAASGGAGTTETAAIAAATNATNGTNAAAAAANTTSATAAPSVTVASQATSQSIHVGETTMDEFKSAQEKIARQEKIERQRAELTRQQQALAEKQAKEAKANQLAQKEQNRRAVLEAPSKRKYDGFELDEIDSEHPEFEQTRTYLFNGLEEQKRIFEANKAAEILAQKQKVLDSLAEKEARDLARKQAFEARDARLRGIIGSTKSGNRADIPAAQVLDGDAAEEALKEATEATQRRALEQQTAREAAEKAKKEAAEKALAAAPRKSFSNIHGINAEIIDGNPDILALFSKYLPKGD